MATLYLMRHGQTLFNVLKRKQGWCDSPLTEAGVEQAKRAGAWFVERGISFDHAYSSTSERACDTLELVVPGMPYTRLKGLKEWNFGTFEGLTEDTNPPLPYGDFYVPFGGEGEQEMRDRLMETIGSIMERPQHESVLAVSHGAATAGVLRELGFDWHADGRRLGNCCIAVLDYRDGSFSVRDLVNPND